MKKNQRYFEIISNYTNHNIKIPQRQTKFSAGYDLESAEDIIFQPKEIKLVPTGVKAYFEPEEFLIICIRSSVPIKKKLILSNGVGIIDHDYYNNKENEGHIFISLYNFTNETIKINKGERIAQGIFQKYYLVTEKIDNNKISNNKRKGGFGSTNY
ncbi:DUTPase [Candidatus Phytoplasma mali]|uniref:dUTP diphosphatase n=1 Tax=Phytoplasma mali (strain AT) TaxID=482235 RepID=B3QZN1_PHYMT|nr:dUTP diphosphatase [Candidatus Phytoplasma mali]CAP18418.1 DUTPase [Candidatus Phytoplasma mali]